MTNNTKLVATAAIISATIVGASWYGGQTPLEIAVFAGVIVFVLTAVATLGGVVGLIRFEERSHLNALFGALVLELVALILAPLPDALTTATPVPAVIPPAGVAPPPPPRNPNQIPLTVRPGRDGAGIVDLVFDNSQQVGYLPDPDEPFHDVWRLEQLVLQRGPFRLTGPGVDALSLVRLQRLLEETQDYSGPLDGDQTTTRLALERFQGRYNRNKPEEEQLSPLGWCGKDTLTAIRGTLYWLRSRA